MNILISPNAFKNSLGASEAAISISNGFSESRLDCTCTCFPVGDGGDGTGELIIHAFSGNQVKTKVHDPLKRKIETSFGLIDHWKTAIIEMANASGIRLLKPSELDPMRATTTGTGEQIRVALDAGVNKIILGVGGSATVDGGVGIVSALGGRFLDSSGNELFDLPGSLNQLYSIDLSGLDPRMQYCNLVILCDVRSPLVGQHGAAAVFGPQKGATPQLVKQLDSGLNQLARVILDQMGKNIAQLQYGGSAGGAAAGLLGLLGGKLVSGIDYFLEITGFDKALEATNLVITGEGSIDDQTLEGKGPFGVAQRAKSKGLPVIGIAGKVPKIISPNLQHYFDVLLAIGNGSFDEKTSMTEAAENLRRTSLQLGNLLALL